MSRSYESGGNLLWEFCEAKDSDDKMLTMTKAIARMTDKDVGWPLPDTTDKEMIATLLETLPRIRAAFSPTQAALRTKNLEFIEDQLSPVMTSSEESSKLEITEDLLRMFWISSHFNHSSSEDQFIWHSGFPPKINLIDPSSMQGSLNYGESIQDKWFLVRCFFQISSQFDCKICVSNSNGKFKLIEAAEVLLFRSRADTFSSHDQTTTINSNYTAASANSSPVISVHSQNKLASGVGPKLTTSYKER
ncbi:hypothetical protein BY996DRAFT_6490983 [Phakopsora pachyrhizi]|nr:hypothetical protein BY996DRAFT_6490983 [Phakopsora pachyrhizi]